MKKTAAIFLLCVYALMQVAYICWYFYKPLAHAYFLRQSQYNPVEPNKGLLSITIGRSELDGLKNEEGEIVIDGILYDVETSVVCGTMIKLLLKADSDETSWNIHYKKITNLLYKHNGDRHTTTEKISFTLLPLFCYKEVNTDLSKIKFLHKAQDRSATNFSSGPAKDLVTPPPRLG